MAGLRGFFEADVKIPFCKFYVVDRKLCTANVRYFSPIVAQYFEHMLQNLPCEPLPLHAVEFAYPPLAHFLLVLTQPQLLPYRPSCLYNPLTWSLLFLLASFERLQEHTGIEETIWKQKLVWLAMIHTRTTGRIKLRETNTLSGSKRTTATHRELDALEAAYPFCSLPACNWPRSWRLPS